MAQQSHFVLGLVKHRSTNEPLSNALVQLKVAESASQTRTLVDGTFGVKVDCENKWCSGLLQLLVSHKDLESFSANITALATSGGTRTHWLDASLPEHVVAPISMHSNINTGSFEFQGMDRSTGTRFSTESSQHLPLEPILSFASLACGALFGMVALVLCRRRGAAARRRRRQKEQRDSPFRQILLVNGKVAWHTGLENLERSGSEFLESTSETLIVFPRRGD